MPPRRYGPPVQISSALLFRSARSLTRITLHFPSPAFHTASPCRCLRKFLFRLTFFQFKNRPPSLLLYLLPTAQLTQPGLPPKPPAAFLPIRYIYPSATSSLRLLLTRSTKSTSSTPPTTIHHHYTTTTPTKLHYPTNGHHTQPQWKTPKRHLTPHPPPSTPSHPRFPPSPTTPGTTTHHHPPPLFHHKLAQNASSPSLPSCNSTTGTAHPRFPPTLLHFLAAHRRRAGLS